ncbi:unnamed protein product [Euphydryas editha]|uniref:Uncharacterized protein n=1 Tax=Euphydryas editha TaxID=104508 RepID=A0AAU9TGL8_EUPED|nr:unnamed protein product [Euphydryas editha]
MTYWDVYRIGQYPYHIKSQLGVKTKQFVATIVGAQEKIIMKLFVCVFLMLLGVFSQARHIHPVKDSDELQNKMIFEEINDIETGPIDVLNLKPTRFVPINNVLFFKSFEPCEDGFKRDVLGICREVWD